MAAVQCSDDGKKWLERVFYSLHLAAVSPIVMFISSCSATSTISVTPPGPLQGAVLGLAVNGPAQHQTEGGLSAVNLTERVQFVCKNYGK